MRMYLYYAWHSFLGVIRKLFRTWVAILILVCVIFGLVVGVLADAVDGAFSEDPVQTNQASPDFEETQEIVMETPSIDPETGLAIGELLAGALVLGVLCLNVFTGEKSGSHLFTMADVNLVFPSPRKPQSVLLFKLGTRIGAYVLITLYLGFQIPNLLNLGLPVPLVLSLFPTWFFLLVFGQLLAVLVYTLTATRENARKIVRPAVYAVLGAAAVSFFLFTRLNGLTVWEGAVAFFNAPASRLIPVWGWIKAIPFLVSEGKWLYLALDGTGLILLTVFLIRWIYSLDADFYEDALTYAAELDRATREAAENGKGFARLRKKERKGETPDLMLKGTGGAVFFYKALFNRLRLAKFRVFSKTCVTYLFLAVLGAAFGRFVVQSNHVLFLAAPMAIAVFIRSFGNPIREDTTKPFFLLIPEKTGKKVFFSHLGGSVGTMLDLIPAFVLGWLILQSDPMQALLWLLVLFTLDFYAASFGVFTDFILPDSMPKQIKTAIQVLLIYFSVLPGGVCLLAGFLSGNLLLFLPLTALVNFLIGTGLTACSGAILENGRS